MHKWLQTNGTPIYASFYTGISWHSNQQLLNTEWLAIYIIVIWPVSYLHTGSKSINWYITVSNRFIKAIYFGSDLNDTLTHTHIHNNKNRRTNEKMIHKQRLLYLYLSINCIRIKGTSNREEDASTEEKKKTRLPAICTWTCSVQAILEGILRELMKKLFLSSCSQSRSMHPKMINHLLRPDTHKSQTVTFTTLGFLSFCFRLLLFHSIESHFSHVKLSAELSTVPRKLWTIHDESNNNENTSI